MVFEQSDRLKAIPPYVFAEMARKKRAAVAAGRDVIDFGVGDPDRPAYPFIIEALDHALTDPQNHRYELGGGTPAFRQAIATYFHKRYGVELDPQREVLALVGSKEGIGHLPLAVVNPGQRVLIPSPGYPAYLAGTVFAAAEPTVVALRAEGGWRPDFDAIPAAVADQAALMFLNYPNNPTGAVATLEFFERAVAFARRHNIILAQDAAYNELYFGQEKPPSILEVPGARDVAIEFHSASKTFNMTGWRVGFAVGNASVLAALQRLKSNLDSGAFAAIQAAAAVAYSHIDGPEVIEARAMYRRRAEALCEALRQLHFTAEAPTATFYVWAHVPAGYDSMTLCNRLLEEADIVATPGSGFGPTGEGFVRFSLGVPDARVATAIDRMRKLSF